MATSPWTFGWDALVAMGTLALAVVTGSLAVATVVTAKQTRKLVASTERGTAVAVVIGLFREFRTMSPARYRLGPELAKFDADVPLRDLPESTRVDAFDLAHFLDNLGFLVESDFVKVELVQGFMGGSVVDLWEKLGPHIEAERRRREEAVTIRGTRSTSNASLSACTDGERWGSPRRSGTRNRRDESHLPRVRSFPSSRRDVADPLRRHR
jgi:hypothetical protein